MESCTICLSRLDYYILHVIRVHASCQYCRIFFFFFDTEWCALCVYLLFITYSPIHKHLDSFHILIIVSSAAVNIRVQITIQDANFNSFGQMPRSGISRSYNSYVFNFLMNLCILFLSGYIIFLSHRQYTRVPFLHIIISSWYLLF